MSTKGTSCSNVPPCIIITLTPLQATLGRVSELSELRLGPDWGGHQAALSAYEPQAAAALFKVEEG